MSVSRAAAKAEQPGPTPGAELMPVMPWTADESGRVISVGRQWQRITGLSRSHALGEGWNTVLHPDDVKLTLEQWHRSTLTGAPYDVIHRVRLRDGSFHWFRTRATPERNDRGCIVQWHGVSYDVHELKETQDALRQSEERFRRVVEHIHDAVIMDDSQGRIIFANDRFLSLFGFDRDEIQDLVLENYVAPEYRAALRERHDRRIRGEPVPTQFQYEGFRKNGTRLWLEVDVVPVKDGTGKIIGTQSAIRDITPRQVAERELHERARRLRLAVDTAALGFYERDIATNQVTMNKYLREILGVGPGPPPPDVIDRAFHPEDREALFKLVERAYDPQVKETVTAEFRVVRPNGEVRWVAGRGRVLFDKTKKPPQPAKFVGVLVDITHRKLAEQELKRAREELARINAQLEKRVAERTAELSALVADVEQMSYSMIHDLRAPLRAIHSYAELLGRGSVQFSDQQQQFLQRIRQSTERMDALVKETLSYSMAMRRELPLEAVDLRTLLTQIIDTSPEYQPPLANILLEGDFPAVTANPSALAQCCSNLLSNAVKFVAAGTSPEVRIYAEPAPGPRPHTTPTTRPDARAETKTAAQSQPQSPRVRIWFADNGIGIPWEGREKLFSMFERMHGPEYPGTGIGLALVRKMIERMGGRVGVASEPGKGSRFWLELPMVEH